MKRPKSCQLGPHKLKIKYSKDLKDGEGKLLYGLADFGANTIFICTHFDGEKLDEDVIEHSIYHEVFHFVLNGLNLHDLNNNDPFVDTVAGAINQFVKTLK